jgi:uncharacterized protein
VSDAADTVDASEVTPDFTTAKAVLTYVVQQLVDDVIGKRGRVAQSIRTVVRAAAARDGGDVEVEFLD